MSPAGHAAEFDLLVRNGMLVIPGVGEVRADIAVADDRIVALGENLAGSANSTFDASGFSIRQEMPASSKGIPIARCEGVGEAITAASIEPMRSLVWA